MGKRFDNEWRARALGGDEAAVDALADAAFGPLYRFCLYRVGGDRHLCEEVVQETLLAAIDRLERYDPDRCEADPLPWLRGLARNEARRVLRREGAALRWDRLDAVLRAAFARIEAQPLGVELLERQETRELVNATMAQLPGHYRDALEGRYLRDTPVRALASRWDLSEKAAEARLVRARRAFRAAFVALSQDTGWEGALT